MYRILTERKNVDTIKKMILAPRFNSYTLINATGYWLGISEDSLVIEIDTSEEERVYATAKDIRELNSQEAVLVQRIESHSELI